MKVYVIYLLKNKKIFSLPKIHTKNLIIGSEIIPTAYENHAMRFG